MVIRGVVVAGCSYDANRNTHMHDITESASWRYASDVAKGLPAPQDAYILDVCEADGERHLLELNSFSGAGLYACDRSRVVDTVSGLAAALVGYEAQGR